MELDLMEEFAEGLEALGKNPNLVKMANAKWQGALLAALAESEKGGSGSIEAIVEEYEALSHRLVQTLDLDETDPRIRNVAAQALIPMATEELRQTGNLTGAWLSDYAQAIEQIPGMVKVVSSPINASTSLGMTLTNHYASLYAMTNEFAFLRPPDQLVQWAHDQIHSQAQASAERISTADSYAPAYQNQLNVHRRLFESAYHTEAKQWRPMAEQHPQALHLYREGLPIEGIQSRFEEQAQQLQHLMGQQRKQTITMVQ